MKIKVQGIYEIDKKDFRIAYNSHKENYPSTTRKEYKDIMRNHIINIGSESLYNMIEDIKDEKDYK